MTLQDQGATTTLRTRASVRVALLAAAVVASLAVLVWQGVVWRDATTEAEARTAVAAVARDQVDDFVNFTPADVDARMEAIRDRSDDRFADQVEDFAGTFAANVRDGGVTTTGEVVGVGVRDLQADSASVLVAATAAIAMPDAEAIESVHRVQVDLRRDGDDWKVTNMEFVQ
ncbi:hypothetical protein [Nocardioides zeae]|uniref:Mce-associated membrane protein n=1 Tax=Nocardioides zeae TaxID=1457234 RepID=A0A6P0HG41_9ACTN|nr:hypothetical protein [Nocardioides zeae]NEN77593.1 hypothetical protein [Nocardioides zeae]